MEEKKPRRNFTPEQKYEILQDISTFPTIKEGLATYQLHDSVYRTWKRHSWPWAFALRYGTASRSKGPRSQEIGGGESEVEGNGAHAIADPLRVKKRDDLGLPQGGHLMNEQKQAVMQLVDEQRAQGRPVGEMLHTLGIGRSTYRVTQEFFESLGAELSFARVRRPTDNAITERFYGTIKQEEIDLMGNDPDEHSAREELQRSIIYDNTKRPHQAVMNFTPA